MSNPRHWLCISVVQWTLHVTDWCISVVQWIIPATECMIWVRNECENSSVDATPHSRHISIVYQNWPTSLKVPLEESASVPLWWQCYCHCGVQLAEIWQQLIHSVIPSGQGPWTVVPLSSQKSTVPETKSRWTTMVMTYLCSFIICNSVEFVINPCVLVQRKSSGFIISSCHN